MALRESCRRKGRGGERSSPPLPSGDGSGERTNQGGEAHGAAFRTCKQFNLPFPPMSSPRTFPTISVKTMARELLMGTARVRSE